MLCTILYSSGTQQTHTPNEAGRIQWKTPACSGNILISLDNTTPCLLTEIQIYADDANRCIITPENGTAISPDIMVMEKNARIRVLIPENCANHTLAGQVWITELPEDHPLPNRLIRLSRDAAERDKAARQEIDALRSASQTLVGSITFPGAEETDKGSSEFMHLQDLYFKTIRSTSWRITAPLRTIKGKIKLMKGLKK